MNYLVDKHGCRLEVTDRAVNVRIRFRGSVSIPLSSIEDVGTSPYRSTMLIQILTRDGMYEWALGNSAYEAANAIAEAANLPRAAASR